MAKLTHYTSFQDLKEHRVPMYPKQADLSKESELKEFVKLLVNHRHSKSQVRADNSPNHPTNGR